MTQPWPFSIGFEFVKAKPYDSKAQERLEALYREAFAHHLRWGAIDEAAQCATTADHGSLAWAEEKLDGWRALIVRESGATRVYSRGVSKVTGQHIDLLVSGPGGGGSIRCIDAMTKGLHDGTAIEGELYWPGHRATQVPEALKSHRDELEFKAFDLFAVGGMRSLSPLRDKRALLAEFRIPLSQILRVGDGANPIHTFGAEGLSRIAEFHGLEGLVVKASCLTEPLWYKVKCEAVDDVVVLDTTDANFGLTGKFSGLVGALVVGVRCPVCKPGDAADHDCWELDGARFREVAQVSGMDDAQRTEMTKQRETLPGRTCEVRFQKVGADQRLRHPRFVRWRDDEKQKHECFGLEIFGSFDNKEEE